MSTDTEAEKPKALLMFVRLEEGRHVTEPREKWVVVTEEEVKSGNAVLSGAKAQIHYYDDLRRKLKHATPGAVFAVTLRDSGISFTPKSWPVLKYENNFAVAQWRAETTAAERAASGAKDFEKQVTRQLDREGLEPYREAYRRINSPQRVQLIAEVVRYITAGS